MRTILIFIALLSLSLSGCDEKKVFSETVGELNRLRGVAVSQMDMTPYRKDQYQAFQAYFAQAAEWVLMLKSDAKTAKGFNAALDRQDLNALCEKLFVSRSAWTRIMENCTRNRFFLCSEEVRAYPDLLRALRESMSEANRIRFDQGENCKKAGLRAING
jgi:hypothetical protein